MNKTKIVGWNNRYLYFVNNHLFIFSSKYDTEPKEIYTMADLKSIQDVTEFKGIKDKDKNLIIQINSKKKNELVFLADSESTKDKWFELLQNIFNPTGENDNLLQSLGLVSENVRRASMIQPKPGESPGQVLMYPISEEMSEQDVSDLFEIFGTITSIKFFRDKKFPGIPDDVAMITYAKEMDAEKAVALNGISVEEQRVTVQVYVKQQSIDPLYLKSLFLGF
jgi:RNA recognition motif-containing protein